MHQLQHLPSTSLAALARVCALFLLAFLSLASAACSTTPHKSNAPLTPAPTTTSSRSIPIYDGKQGTRVTWDNLLIRAAAADIIIIGENHNHPVGLPWAATLFEGLAEKAPLIALSLEFFERDDQSRLDDYLKGVTDEAAFRKRTARTPGNYPEGHRRMIQAAKAHGRPVIASNTPWSIIRFLRGKPYYSLSALTPEQKRLYRIPDSPPEGRYRADFDAIMGPMAEASRGTKPGEKPAPLTDEERQARLDTSFRAQSLWDWTMADSVVKAAEVGAKPVVHVIGRFHSDFFGGTPQAIATLRPGASILIISVVDHNSATLADADKNRGDFVVYVGPSPD